jgi:hypothetical protein
MLFEYEDYDGRGGTDIYIFLSQKIKFEVRVP